MNTDNGNDDLELTQLVDQRIDAAAEDHSNSREREHQHLGNGPPSEILVALDPRSSTKSSDENDGFDLMEIVAQRAADARATIDSEQTDSEQTETLVQPGAYAVNGVTSRPQEEDEPSVDNDEEPFGPHKAGESWEEDDIQSVAHPIDHQGSEEMLPSEVPLIAVARPIDHQGLEELLPSGVPFIARNRTVWNRKLWCYVSLEFFVGMLIVTTFLVIFVVLNRTIRGKESTSQSVAENGAVRVPVLPAATQAPSSLIDGILTSLNLPNYTLEALQDHRSPQCNAYEWLLENRTKIQTYPNWRLTQLFALATFFFSTRGDFWVHNQGWLDWEVHECNWEQQIFSPDSPDMQCDDSGHIHGLSFSRNNLDGTIPPELSLLSADLELLDLTGNLELKGQIPTEIGCLTKLTVLGTFKTELSGTIPTELGLLSGLRLLRLGGGWNMWNCSHGTGKFRSSNRHVHGQYPADRHSPFKTILANKLDILGNTLLPSTSLGGSFA